MQDAHPCRHICPQTSIEKLKGTYPGVTESEVGLLVGWLLNVPATCECISGTDLLRQFNVLPH